MAGQTTARVVTYGFAPENDVKGGNFALRWPDGASFSISANGTTRVLRSKLIGRTMAYPFLAAVAVACVEGLDLDAVWPALEALKPTAGRLEPIELPSGAIVLRDDVKSALETVEAALDLLLTVPATRRFAVLGDIDDTPGKPGNSLWADRRASSGRRRSGDLRWALVPTLRGGRATRGNGQ